MSLEPVNLKTPLTAIFNGICLGALWTSVERNKLLVELFAVSMWIIKPVLLILPNVLQWALVVLTLTHVDKFIVRWLCIYIVELHGRITNSTNITHTT